MFCFSVFVFSQHARVVGNGSISAQQPAPSFTEKKRSVPSSESTITKPREGNKNSIGPTPTAHHSYQPQRDYYREKVHLLGPVPSKYVSFDSRVGGVSPVNTSSGLSRKEASASVPELANTEQYKVRQTQSSPVSHSLEGLCYDAKSGLLVEGKMFSPNNSRKEREPGNGMRSLLTESQGRLGESSADNRTVDLVKGDRMPSKLSATIVSCHPEESSQKDKRNKITRKSKSKTYPDKRRSVKESWLNDKDSKDDQAKDYEADALKEYLKPEERCNENEMFPLQRSNSWNSSQREEKETLHFYFKPNSLQKSSSFNSKDKKIITSSPTVKQLIQDVQEPPYFYTKDFKKKMAFLKHHDIRGHEEVVSELEYRLRTHHLNKAFPDSPSDEETDANGMALPGENDKLDESLKRSEADIEVKDKVHSSSDEVANEMPSMKWPGVDSDQYFTDVKSFVDIERSGSEDHIEQSDKQTESMSADDESGAIVMVHEIIHKDDARVSNEAIKDVELKDDLHDLGEKDRTSDMPDVTADRLARVKSQVLAEMNNSQDNKLKYGHTPAGEFRYGSHGLILDEYEDEPGLRRSHGQGKDREAKCRGDVTNELINENSICSRLGKEKESYEEFGGPGRTDQGESMLFDPSDFVKFKSEMECENPILKPQIYSDHKVTASSFVKMPDEQSIRSSTRAGQSEQPSMGKVGKETVEADQKRDMKSTKKKAKKSKDGKKKSKKVVKSVSFKQNFPQRDAYVKLCGIEQGQVGLDKENMQLGNTMVFHSEMRDTPSIPSIFRTRSLPNTYDIDEKLVKSTSPVESFDSIFEVKNPTDDFKSKVLSMEGSPKVYKSRRVSEEENFELPKEKKSAKKKKKRKKDKRESLRQGVLGGEDTSSLMSAAELESVVSLAAVLNDSAVCAFMQGTEDMFHQSKPDGTSVDSSLDVHRDMANYQESSFLHPYQDVSNHLCKEHMQKIYLTHTLSVFCLCTKKRINV